MTFLVDAGSIIASGDRIDLNATELTYQHNNLFQVPQVPGKSTGSSWNFRLPVARYSGFESIQYTVNGFFDDTGTSYKNPPTGTTNYFITGSMLHGLATSGSVYALIDPRIINARPTGSGSLAYVIISGYKMARNTQSAISSSDIGYVMDYSLELREIQV